MRHRLPLAAALAAAALLPSLAAQTEPLRSELRPSPVRSGAFANPTGAEVLVFQRMVSAPGAPWVRLVVDERNLPAGSYLEVVSLRDGHRQVLDDAALQQWHERSAYFNGDTLLVRLWAGPFAKDVHFSSKSMEAGLPPEHVARTICGPTDDRVQSFDPRAARLLSVGCTAWLINGANCFVSAGHCCQSGATTVQFNVPLSSSSGSLRHPPPEDQYPVDGSSRQFVNGGQGNDWCVFQTFANTTTGQHAGQRQGQWFQVGNFKPAPGATIRITGYGTTSPRNQLNQVQKTHTGPLSTNSGTRLCYRTDTSGGNSGSPVIDEATGMAVGVHTHGGCTSFGGCNTGTSITRGAFWSTVQACIQPVTASFRTFGSGCAGSSGSTPALTSGSRPVTGTSFRIDLTGGQPNSWALLHQGGNNTSWHGFTLPLAIPPAPQCTLYLAPTSTREALTDAQGDAFVDVAVPNNTALIGHRVFWQWRVRDPAANAWGWTMSNAGEGTVGNQ